MVPSIRPLHGFVQVEDIPLPLETKTNSGIIIQVKKEVRIRFGRVVALGPGPDKKGRKVFHDVKVGDVVMFDCYMGNQFQDKSYYGGQETSWRIVSEDQLLGAVDGEVTAQDLVLMSVKSAHN